MLDDNNSGALAAGTAYHPGEKRLERRFACGGRMRGYCTIAAFNWS